MRTIKTIATAVIGMLLTAACTTDKGNKLTYHIEGTAEGLADGQQLQLANDEGEPFDTIVIKNGKFTYDGKADSVACYVINVMSDEFNSVNYFTEPGTIAITITATPGQSTVSGTIANDALQRLSEATNPYYEKIHEIEEIIYKDTVLSKDSAICRCTARSTRRLLRRPSRMWTTSWDSCLPRNTSPLPTARSW